MLIKTFFLPRYIKILYVAEIHRNAPKDETLDVVIEVSGGTSVLSQGLRFLRPGGLYIFVDTRQPQLDLHLPIDILMKKMLTVQGIIML